MQESRRSTFAAAYAKYFEDTARFLRARGCSQDLSEEIAQAAWVRGWERLPQLRDLSMLQAWINKIALNLFRNAVRRPAHQIVELYGHEAPTLDGFARMDARTVLAMCDDFDRQLLELFYLQGFTATEIGRKLGLNPTTIRVRLMRIRRKVEQATTSGPPWRDSGGSDKD